MAANRQTLVIVEKFGCHDGSMRLNINWKSEKVHALVIKMMKDDKAWEKKPYRNAGLFCIRLRKRNESGGE